MKEEGKRGRSEAKEGEGKLNEGGRQTDNKINVGRNAGREGSKKEREKE